MATTRPFAYNTGSTISGTIQVGTIAVGVDDFDYSEQPGGVQWWNGPDEDLGYVITHPTPAGNQPNPLSIPAFLGFWRSKLKTEPSFITIAQWVSAKHGSPQIFATGMDAATWLNNNGYWTSYNQNAPTPTPSATQLIPTLTPTPTPTETESILTPTPTPTLTPTPTETSLPVTGYSFNLVDLPYNFPSSGNTIMNNASGIQTGSTEINELSGASRGLYFNSIDLDGVDRTSYFSAFTGQNITITFNQNGNVAIYSGDTNSLKSWSQSGDDGFVFGTNIGVPPSGTPSGTATLLQSSPVNYTIGLPVYVSVELNVPVTPTPTPTQQTPTPTPTQSVGGDGWFFYTPEGQVMGPPTSNGNAIFLPPSGGSTYNPNYTGGTFNLFFNGFTSGGTSYVTEFQGLDTTGGTITITQNGESVSYSGDSTQFSYVPAPNNYLQLQVTSSAQVILSGSTSFVSGSPITIIVNGSPSSTPTPTPTVQTPTPTPTLTSTPTLTPTLTNTPTLTSTSTSTPTPTPTETQPEPTPTPTPTQTVTPTPTTPPAQIIVAAGGVNALGYSYDGDNWTNSSNGATFISQPTNAVAASPTLFVAGGQSGSTQRLIYSQDGDTWSASTNGNSIFNSVFGVAYGGGKFVAVGISTSATAGIGYSLDGMTWSASTLPGVFGSTVIGIAFNGSRWVATAQAGGGALPKNTLAYSDDGITWSASTNSQSIFTSQSRGVAWGDNKWVAVGTGTNRIAYSTDGVVWSASTSGNSLITGTGYGVGYNGSQFVACGQGGNSLIYSNDGITWSASTNGNSIFSLIAYDATWDGSKWIAGGIGTNQLATSIDGLTWSATTNGNTIFNNRVQSIAVK